MPTFLPGYVKPGFYVAQRDISAPAVTPGVRIAAIIGQGAKTLGRSENIVKGAKNGQDGPLVNNTVINLVSVVSNGTVYRQGIDFKLTRSGADALVDWSLLASLTGTADLSALSPDVATALDGKTLNLTLDGITANPVITFSAAGAGGLTALGNNAAAVAAFINQWVGSTVATIDGSNRLVLSANSILVNPGSGSANALLGLTDFSSAAIKEPATGSTYTCNYVSDKTDAEYAPAIFTDMNKVVTSYGERRPQVEFESGAVVTSATKTLTASAPGWTVDEWQGFYVRITAGLGKGQVRVVISNTADTLTVSRDWSDLQAPDATSTFSITDVNINSISKGIQVCKDIGGTVFIASQYEDDIFNDPNIKDAITALESDVQGFRPYSITLMRGLGSTEVDPVNFLKAHVEKMSDTQHNKWRMSTFGLAQGNEDFTTFTQLATGTLSDRMFLPNLSTLVRDFGFGKEKLDGSYLAAAYAGIFCANEDAGEPFTGRSVSNAFSVADLVDPFNEEEKLLMGAAGVSVFERQGNDLVLVDDLSTDQSTQLKKYGRFCRMKDFVSGFYKDGLKASTVGQRFVVSTTGQADVVGNTKANFNLLTIQLQKPADPTKQIVNKVEDLLVEQDKSESDQLDISASVYLTPEVKYVFMLLGFGV